VAFGLVEKPVGTLDLLVYLLRHGRTSMNTIQADTGMGKETFYRAVDRLKSLGFVYQEEETGFPTHVYLGLTRTGESVARALLPVADLLASTARSLAEELDSLEEANQPITKLRRIELLGTIAEQEFSSGRWGPTREKAARLIELAHETKEVRSEALGRIMLGRILQKQDAHEEAFRELESAGRLARDARLEIIGHPEAGELKRDFVLVNRYSVDHVASDLILGFFFPAAHFDDLQGVPAG